jgi:hypothetical protein
MRGQGGGQTKVARPLGRRRQTTPAARTPPGEQATSCYRHPNPTDKIRLDEFFFFFFSFSLYV